MLSTLKLYLRPMLMVTAILALTMSAQATTIVFGIGGTTGFTDGGDQDGPVDVGGGVTLTATPWASGWGDKELTVTRKGYGVRSGRHDSGKVDGDGRDEGVILTFSRAVTVWDIELRKFSPWREIASYTVDGSPAGANMTGRVFGIFAFDDDTDFRVRSVSFTPSSVVPEVGTSLSVAAGIALLGLACFRRK